MMLNQPRDQAQTGVHSILFGAIDHKRVAHAIGAIILVVMARRDLLLFRIILCVAVELKQLEASLKAKENQYRCERKKENRETIFES